MKKKITVIQILHWATGNPTEKAFYFQIRWDLRYHDIQIPIEQESPPAWTQEAYRPPCSEYSFCCPTRVPPPGGVPDPGTPPGGYRTWVPPRGGTWPRYPPQGGYRTWVTPPGGYLTRVPPGGVPDLGTPPAGGTWPRYPPPGGYRTWVPPGGVPDPGTPPGGYQTRVPPRGGTRTPPPPPVWTDKQSETITFPSYYVRGR